MEEFDQQRAAQIWQRVHSAQTHPRPEEGLLELIAREAEDAAIYLSLARMEQGRAGMLLRKLYEQEQTHVACLKGIYTLTTGKRANVAIPKLSPDKAESVLRRCYGREMRCLAQYEQRSGDPEYGQVFARLAEQERDHCRAILELLGGGLTR